MFCHLITQLKKGEADDGIIGEETGINADTFYDKKNSITLMMAYLLGWFQDSSVNE